MQLTGMVAKFFLSCSTVQSQCSSDISRKCAPFDSFVAHAHKRLAHVLCNLASTKRDLENFTLKDPQ